MERTMDENIPNEMSADKNFIKEKVLDSVKNNGWALADASDELKCDREFIFDVLKINGWAMKYVCDTLKSDPPFILEALNYCDEAFTYASNEIKGNREIALQAVKKHGGALQFASEGLRADIEIVQTAVNTNVWAFEFASDSLKQNLDFVKDIVAQNGWAFKYASDDLKTNPDLMAISEISKKRIADGLKDEIYINSHVYKHFHLISQDGHCTQGIYSAITEEGQEVIIKLYPKGKEASAFDFGKNNHYGRMRDVSEVVFDEITLMGKQHDFLVRFIDRGRIEDAWVLVIEKVPGKLLYDFLLDNINDKEILTQACDLLGKEIRKWHNAQFAHGDAHLKNVIIDFSRNSIKLVDLNMVHHPLFESCKKANCCFDTMQPNNRYAEDLGNTTGMGRGFIHELQLFEKENRIDSLLVDAFMEGYRYHV